MAAFHGCFPFFLLFLISLCSVSTSSRHAPSPCNVVISIRDDLPNIPNQEPLRLDWDDGSYFTTYQKPGDHYNRTLKAPRNVVQCDASWSRWFSWAPVPVYDAKRDKGHLNVYWSVRKDGFYHSWDGIKWRFIQQWYTE